MHRYELTTQVDFRCGFNKKFLQEGGLKDSEVSRVIFKDDNFIDIDLHFGCAVYALDKPQEFNINALLELVQSMTLDKDDPRWKTNKSFYMSTTAYIQAEFGQDARTTQSVEVMKMVGSLLGASNMIENLEE